MQPYSNSAKKNPYNSDRKTTDNHHAPSSDAPNRSDDISTAASANHNGDSDDGTAAALAVGEQYKEVVRPIATYVPDVQYPARATSTSGTESGKSEKNTDSQQQLSDVPQRAISAEKAAAPPTILVSRQRLRQKLRARPNKRERQLQRQRERHLQTQHGQWTTEGGVGAVNAPHAIQTKRQQSVVVVQQHPQVSQQPRSSGKQNGETIKRIK